ncbi:transcription factor E2F5-like [Watersipora subatra]|uniref:transcription factor E2F5-like n=1 Tax=Watersipora subatra TaxID=2589382 RepID=UPI00355B9154
MNAGGASAVDSELEASLDGPPSQESTVGVSRHEKSLGLLTSRFVALLQSAEDGILDLKAAADVLAVKQKRRIYDITNVLEGIGLIEKRSKNSIQWKGAGPSNSSGEVASRLTALKQEIDDLDAQERTLDQQKKHLQQNLRNVSEDPLNYQVAYVTHEDICNSFRERTLLAIQAPSGTTLEVPVPEGVMGSANHTTAGPSDLRTQNVLKRKYQIHLKSDSGPINVLLVNKDSEGSEPVAVPVPPPKEKTLLSVQLSPSPSSYMSIPSSCTDPPSAKRLVLDSPVSVIRESSLSTNGTSPKTRLRTSPRTKSSISINNVLHSIKEGDMQEEEAELVTPGGIFSNTHQTEYSVDELMSSELFSPLLRLSPPPSERDYCFNLDDTEGVADLFDIVNYPA